MAQTSGDWGERGLLGVIFRTGLSEQLAKKTMEMKTRNSSWMSLLCPKGWGPRRSRAHATSLNPFLLGGKPQQKKGLSSGGDPCHLARERERGGGEKDQYPEGHLSGP